MTRKVSRTRPITRAWTRRAAWSGLRGQTRAIGVLALVALLGTAQGGATAPAVPLVLGAFAGTGAPGDAGDEAPAVEARLHAPTGLAARPSGTVYIADSANSRVRQVDDGTITTVAGNGEPGYDGDGGPAREALLDQPVAVAARPSGELLVADAGSHTVRVVWKDRIETLAGSGRPGHAGDGGPAVEARLHEPRGVTARPSGETYIADTGNHVVRRVTGDGNISTVAGTGKPGYSGDGGDATDARFRRPVGVAVTPSGTLYVADTGNHVVRMVDHHGIVTTIAGNGEAGYSGDGGQATDAALREPTGVGIDSSGALLIADAGNHVIRKVDTDGTISTIAGTGQRGDADDGAPAAESPLNQPVAVTHAGGAVLVAEAGGHRVRRLSQPAPPDPPTLEGTDPASPADDNTPRVLGEAQSGTTVELHIDDSCGGDPAASGPAADFADDGLTVTVPEDATTDIYAVAVDAVGLRSSCAGPLAYTETATPTAAEQSSTSEESGETSTEPPRPQSPSLKGTDPPSPANDNTPRVLGEAPADTTVELHTDDSCQGDPAASGPAADLTDDGLTVTVPDDRTTGIYAVAVDAAGVRSECAGPLEYTEMSAPPAAPEILSAPSDPGDRSPTWTFAATAGTVTTCRLYRDLTLLWDGECEGEFTYDLSDQPGSSYRFAVHATDPAGNESATAVISHQFVAEPQGNRAQGGDERDDPAGEESHGQQAGREASALPAVDQEPRRSFRDAASAVMSDSVMVGAAFVSQPGIPLLLLLTAGLFLAVQHSIDRHDPKLALAPRDNPELDFPELLPVRPTPSRPPRRGDVS